MITEANNIEPTPTANISRQNIKRN